MARAGGSVSWVLVQHRILELLALIHRQMPSVQFSEVLVQYRLLELVALIHRQIHSGLIFLRLETLQPSGCCGLWHQAHDGVACAGVVEELQHDGHVGVDAPAEHQDKGHLGDLTGFPSWSSPSLPLLMWSGLPDHQLSKHGKKYRKSGKVHHYLCVAFVSERVVHIAHSTVVSLSADSTRLLLYTLHNVHGYQSAKAG